MAAEERKFQDPEYDYYDVEDEEEEGGRGPVLAIVAIIVAMAFIGVVLVAYQQGKKDGRQEIPPILRADKGATTESPSESASTEPPKSPSLQIFAPSKPEAETMAPPPEEPMAAPKPAPAAIPANPAAKVSPVTPAPVKNVEVKAAPEPGTAAPAPTAEAAPSAAPVAVPASGSYLVQIGSFKSEEEANSTWAKIKAKNSDILGNYAPNIASADLGAKGVFQRLRFGPFDTKEAASGVCAQLKARSVGCLLAKQ